MRREEQEEVSWQGKGRAIEARPEIIPGNRVSSMTLAPARDRCVDLVQSRIRRANGFRPMTAEIVRRVLQFIASLAQFRYRGAHVRILRRRNRRRSRISCPRHRDRPQHQQRHPRSKSQKLFLHCRLKPPASIIKDDAVCANKNCVRLTREMFRREVYLLNMRLAGPMAGALSVIK